MRSVNAENNKAIAILKAAEDGNYGIPGVVSVSLNLQHLNLANLILKMVKTENEHSITSKPLLLSNVPRKPAAHQPKYCSSPGQLSTPVASS